MRFKQWINEESGIMGLQKPQGLKQVAAQGLGNVAKQAAFDLVPGSGVAGAAFTAAVQIWRTWSKGADITPHIRKLMDTQDQTPGIPANAFDLADPISDALSDEAKNEIAKRIAAKIDGVLQKMGPQGVPSDAGNVEAIKYIKSVISPIAGQIRSNQSGLQSGTPMPQSQIPRATPLPQATPLG